MDTLIRKVKLLTMAHGPIIQKDIDIAIDGGRIVAIGHDLEPSYYREVIEGAGKMVMPGLVNAHTHIAMSLLRNYADDLPFWTWLTEKIWPIEEKMTAEDVYHGAMLGIAEMIRSGTTTFSDMYFFMESVALAVEKTGMRANLSIGMIGDSASGKAMLKESLKFASERYGSANGRIRIDLAPHAPYSCDSEFLKQIIEASKPMNLRLHIHLCESAKEVEDSHLKHGKSPVKHVADLGLFSRPTMAAHCVHLSNEDLDLLALHKVNVLYNPGSNLKLANGFAQIHKMLDRGINVALGTDGASSNNNLNLFEEIHLAALLTKGITGDSTAVNAYQALEMATINGAKALGLDDEIGTLELGKKADLIVIDLSAPHFYPRLNLVSSLAYSAGASDVESVMVDGRWLMQGSTLLTLNEKEVLRYADQAALKLIGGSQ
ncbi:MAG: amidohydrolase [Erysipelotrichaceae bacterium]|nr:amidohydrolase [Erysipelotrichaceae bacterium]